MPERREGAMTTTTTTNAGAHEASLLTSKERWIFGGLGGLAPIIVAAATQDLEAIFARLTMLVTLGFCAKIVALFFLGGLVSYLQKAETETWKCFLIGISAPALVTTATARAETSNLMYLSAQVPVLSLNYFSESPWQEFSRGLSGSDPSTTLIVFGEAPTVAEAQAVAAAGWLEFTCGQTKSATQFRPPSFNPVVIDRSDGTFVSGLTTSAGDNFSLLSMSKSIPIRDVISFTRAKSFDVQITLRRTNFPPSSLQEATMAYQKVDPACAARAQSSAYQWRR
jgi:hypothetical protein